jgi:hypothetical protein
MTTWPTGRFINSRLCIHLNYSTSSEMESSALVLALSQRNICSALFLRLDQDHSRLCGKPLSSLHLASQCWLLREWKKTNGGMNWWLSLILMALTWEKLCNTICQRFGVKLQRLSSKMATTWSKWTSMMTKQTCLRLATSLTQAFINELKFYEFAWMFFSLRLDFWWMTQFPSWNHCRIEFPRSSLVEDSLSWEMTLRLEL